MNHSGTWMNWPHKCDETCDPIECDIGVTVILRLVGDGRYYCCGNCFATVEALPVPETCPGCFYPVGRFIH
jgi:hypothetical protein